MRRRRRREAEGLSIAFLDVITSGFGAIILLLLIAKIGEAAPAPPRAPAEAGDLRALQERLFDLREQAETAARALERHGSETARQSATLASLRERLRSIERETGSAADEVEVQSIVRDELATAVQELSAEMERLLARRAKPRNDLIGGIPVDSEYIVFIIDTSGSMFQYAWPRMIRQLEEVLDTYPQVKGMQVLNDMGAYMFTQYRGKWIPDTEGRRRVIVNRLRTWNPFSNSSPAEGIAEAIGTFYDPGRKISLYVFGDEFSGRSIHDVVKTVERLNRRGGSGAPLVRIHAVGFPVQFANPPHLRMTGIRFAALMRELARRNGGAFVGLNDFR